AACGPVRAASPPGAPRAAQTAAGALGAPCGGGLAAAAWADCTLRTLGLREKAAQMVWPQLYGDYVAESSAQWRKAIGWVRDDKVGGILISIGSPTEIAAKLNALQRLSVQPLLVGADLEAGAGFRARAFFVPNAVDLGGAVYFPSQMALGATRDSTLAYAMGRVTAEEGRALGIHVVFSPVLDVNNNPANPVINTRSFSEDPALAAALGAAFVRGVQDGGAIATGKHFPGHGDTDVNSHLALPTVGASRARLDSVELVPFRAAVRAGVGAIMTFHGMMPALDSANVPGTLSARVLGGVLRGELGFRGLIISDAMDMRGVLDQFGPVEAAKRAVAAGADVLIQPTDVAQTIDAVVAGVREGRYDEARLDASVRRILVEKQRLGLVTRRTVSLDSVRAVVGDSSHHALAARIAERAITLVKDSLRQVPMGRLNRGARVLSVTYARRSDLPAGATFNAELRRRFDALRPEWVNSDDPAPNFWRLLQAADSADVVVIGSYVSHSSEARAVTVARGFADFVRELAKRRARTVLVAFGNPYLLQQVPEVPAYLVAWSGVPSAQAAAARALLGAAPISGVLPVNIPPVARFGAGEQRGTVGAASPSP
ncbi:MAG TPA: glycoside hydrolase family 3 N-terminal domain-containing protein, partial [Gemmatimonadaceae bacterium]|nr:glycoside hydrolase family 3 N-terminal domain-containing protein [Gemmatimonadaceae bacterium]